MYFGRFYEFKERLKKYFEAMKKVAPAHGLNIGAFIKRYEKVFADELRERNGIHHHSRFEDLALDRIFLTETISTMRKGDWEQEHIAEYRKLANEWVQRVRSRGAKLEEFLEAVAEATLASCAFLSDSSVSSGQAATNGHAEHVSAFRGLGGALTATDAE